eukprot:g12446.t1
MRRPSDVDRSWSVFNHGGGRWSWSWGHGREIQAQVKKQAAATGGTTEDHPVPYGARYATLQDYELRVSQNVDTLRRHQRFRAPPYLYGLLEDDWGYAEDIPKVLDVRDSVEAHPALASAYAGHVRWDQNPFGIWDDYQSDQTGLGHGWRSARLCGGVHVVRKSHGC